MTGSVYLLNKGPGITSRKAAAMVARAHSSRKYGHCGTLDPDATGLLVVLLGRATRLAPYLSGETKRYSFQLVMGIDTDTLDMSGTVREECPCDHISRSMVIEATQRLTGEFMQQAPLFSAVRVQGRRGYRLARSGENPIMPERPVRVTGWLPGELLDGRMELSVSVSTGTYIRALARDIGRIIGVPAVAHCIRRLEAGSFRLEEASEEADSEGSLLSMAAAMRDYPSAGLNRCQSLAAVRGMAVPGSHEGTVVLLGPDDELIAVAQGGEGLLRPKVVLAREDEL